MIKQILNGKWLFKESKQEQWYEATVPGTVYTDLLNNHLMENPYWKDNEQAALKLMEKDYIYVKKFDISEEMALCNRILLHFDGIDTAAKIILNGQKLAHVDNMHRVWEFDVKDYLKQSENELKIILESPLRYCEEAFAKCQTLGSEDAIDGFVHMRKAHCMFGWDWGAHLPDAGIFRNVSLMGIAEGRINDIYIRQKHFSDYVELKFEVNTDVKDGITSAWEIEITDPDGRKKQYTDSVTCINIENPQLWWPHGYGQQKLYTIEVQLKAGDEVVDTWKRRIGLRTLTVCTEKDQWGNVFAHEVNGVKIFAMGADYIPEDHILGFTSPQRTRRLIEDCLFANFNTIRVWGGGYYPEDWFYDLCDEYGIIVWQDFMFACAVYELTSEFEKNITQEFIDNIKRLRHHASLGLWCGNNEMEMFVAQRNRWVKKETEIRDYLFMYERIIPKILSQYDPETFYWPASPSSGGSFDEPNSANRGDVHFWDVWHKNSPFTEYRKYYFRYLSEFGFQSFPSLETIKEFTDEPSDFNPFSYVMEKHQRNYGANGKILNYMQQMFLYPTKFDTFIYASQLLQAEAIKYGVEHFRRNRGRCMGAIYWQLNDCWPVISWSSVDYCGRYKALHYYARRFFAPVMISCEESGMMSNHANMNRQHFEFEKSFKLNVTNETLNDEMVTVEWEIRNAKASVLEKHSCVLQIPALSSKWLEKIQVSQINIWNEYVSYRAIKDGVELSSGTVIFSYPKYFKYENPKLEYTVSENKIIIRADSYAKSVYITNVDDTLVLTDNYFDMNGGEKIVEIIEGNTEDLRIRSVYDIR